MVILPRVLLGLAAAGALAGCGNDEARDPRYDLVTPGPYVGASALPGTLPTPVPTPKPKATAAPKARKGEKIPSQADAERLRPVIAAWAAAVRRSDPEAAARFFNLPAIVSQGQPRELTTAEEVLAFNAALPCGAELTDVQHNGRYVVGTFRLTERPGSSCDAPGALVRVAFVIRGRRFTEWYQVPDTPGAEPGPPERPALPGSGRVTS